MCAAVQASWLRPAIEGNVEDECGICGGPGIEDPFCDCDGNVEDECGVCGGDGSTCVEGCTDPRRAT